MVNLQDLVYISYTASEGTTGILSMNFTTGNIISVYNLNANLNNLSLKIYSPALYLYYSDCCSTFYRLYYNFSTKPTSVCIDAVPTGISF